MRLFSAESQEKHPWGRDFTGPPLLLLQHPISLALGKFFLSSNSFANTRGVKSFEQLARRRPSGKSLLLSHCSARSQPGSRGDGGLVAQDRGVVQQYGIGSLESLSQSADPGCVSSVRRTWAGCCFKLFPYLYMKPRVSGREARNSVTSMNAFSLVILRLAFNRFSGREVILWNYSSVCLYIH